MTLSIVDGNATLKQVYFLTVANHIRYDFRPVDLFDDDVDCDFNFREGNNSRQYTISPSIDGK